MDVYLNQKRLCLKPRQAIGKGGEADVFALDAHRAAKIFKSPQHPDYAGNPSEQQGAAARIDEHQKKLPALPSALPSSAIAPMEFIHDKPRGRIIGYTMRRLKKTQPLMRYADIRFRQSGVSNQDMIRIFLDLHRTVTAIHTCKTIIGDFNDLNVLVRDAHAYMIDVDSFQFKGFFCRMFTARFMDPLLCDPKGKALTPMRAYQRTSDWYAFTVMLMQSLLFVDPYGGVYRPDRPSERIPHCQRPLKRITIFHDKVRYPRHALRYDRLPDDLLHYFQQVFIRDNRSVFPAALLENLHWTRCAKCGASHARAQCPCCLGRAPDALQTTLTVRGKVTAERIFYTRGVILAATVRDGCLRWLYHANGCFKRENGRSLVQGDPYPDMRFRLTRDRTYIGQNNVLAVFQPDMPIHRISVDAFQGRAMFDANNDHHFWLTNGQLYRDDRWGPFYIGDVLAGQTLFWVGPRFGFGFYRAAAIQAAFVFSARHAGINDSVDLPRFSGELTECACYLSEHYAWFFSAFKENGKIIHQALVIRRDGAVIAYVRGEKDDGSWLGTLYGKCAKDDYLFSVSSKGIVRLAIQNGTIAILKQFPDTHPFIHNFGILLPCAHGLAVIDKHTIQILKIR